MGDRGGGGGAMDSAQLAQSACCEVYVYVCASPDTSCFCLSTLAIMKLLYLALLLVCVVSIGALEHMPTGPEETPRTARVARTTSTDRPIHIPPPNPRIPSPVYPEDPVDLSLNGLKNLEPDELLPRPVYPEDVLDPLPNELEEDMEPNEFDEYDFDDPDLWVDDDEEVQDNARPPRAARVARATATDRPIHIPPADPTNDVPRPVFPEDPADIPVHELEENLEPNESRPRPVFPTKPVDPLPNGLEEDMEPNEFDEYDFDDPDPWVDDDEELVDDDVELLDDDEELQDNARPIWPEDPTTGDGPRRPAA